jgi:hypothetical protein
MGFKEFGALQVRINPQTGADNQPDEQLASAIIQEVDNILEGGAARVFSQSPP